MPALKCQQRGWSFSSSPPFLFKTGFLWQAWLPLQQLKGYMEEVILQKNNFKKHLPANHRCLCSSSVPGGGAYSGLLIFRVKNYILQLPHQEQRVRKRDLLTCSLTRTYASARQNSFRAPWHITTMVTGNGMYTSKKKKSWLWEVLQIFRCLKRWLIWNCCSIAYKNCISQISYIKVWWTHFFLVVFRFLRFLGPPSTSMLLRRMS